MNNNSSISRYIIPSVVGLIAMTSLVHAYAQTNDEDVYLRSQVNPYVTLIELTQATPVDTEASFLTSTEVNNVASSDSEESRFKQFIDTFFSSSSRVEIPESEEGLFTRLLLKFGIDVNTTAANDEEKNPTMITNITVASETSSEARFTWTLNKFADVTIYYTPYTEMTTEVTASSSTPRKKISAFAFTSETTLEELEPNTLYSYLIVVDNHFSNQPITSKGTFRTRSE